MCVRGEREEDVFTVLSAAGVGDGAVYAVDGAEN